MSSLVSRHVAIYDQYAIWRSDGWLCRAAFRSDRVVTPVFCTSLWDWAGGVDTVGPRATVQVKVSVPEGVPVRAGEGRILSFQGGYKWRPPYSVGEQGEVAALLAPDKVKESRRVWNGPCTLPSAGGRVRWRF